MMAVQEIMSANPAVVQEETPLEQVFQLFSQGELTCVAVLNEQNTFVGCITLPDLEKSRQIYDLKEFIQIMVSSFEPDIQGQIREGFSLDDPIDLKAREIMSVRIPTVRPQDSLHLLSEKMLAQNSQNAIVVNDANQVIGWLDTRAFLKLF